MAFASMTAGYAFFVTGERGGLPDSTADSIGFGFALLWVISGAMTATIHWFNRPKFLVPRRFRKDPG